jgi:hypothetical protein
VSAAAGSQRTANWLAESFRACGLGAVVTVEDRMTPMPSTIPPKPLGQGRTFDLLTPLLPAFIGPGRGHWPMPLQGRRRDDPVPPMCWECGKALVGRKRRFCSRDCATAFSLATDHS